VGLPQLNGWFTPMCDQLSKQKILRFADSIKIVCAVRRWNTFFFLKIDRKHAPPGLKKNGSQTNKSSDHALNKKKGRPAHYGEERTALRIEQNIYKNNVIEKREQRLHLTQKFSLGSL